MGIAIISDTHFGDPLGTLVTASPKEPVPTIGPAYAPFARAVGRVDYLILLGDIIDFSVASYQEAYRHARTFFRRLHEDQLAREIIYIPGNHDFDVWHTVEHQVNVINRLTEGQLPRAFKRSVPAVIDDRRPHEKFLLPDVAPHRDASSAEPHYGDLFFDDITRGAEEGQGNDERLRFNFAYPNLYLITGEGSSILLTHGHYLEAFWAFAAEWTKRLAFDDLDLEEDQELSLREMVGINLPLNQLACTGIGQAQPLAELARQIQLEISAGRTSSLRKYFGRFERSLRESSNLSWVKRIALSLAVGWGRKRLLAMLEGLEQTRYSREFLTRPTVRERFRSYYRCSIREIERLHRDYSIEIPRPTHFVFGHTHQPIPWDTHELVDIVDGRPVSFCNTGGWILKEDRASLDFVGAEVLVYESGSGMRSVSIRSEDLYPIAADPREGKKCEGRPFEAWGPDRYRPS